jgi:hypothetical protein
MHGSLRRGEDGHATEAWHEFCEQFQPLGRERRRRVAHAGDVRPRSRQAGDKPGLHRIIAKGDDNGDRHGRLRGRTDRGRAAGDQHVHRELHQVGRQRGQPLVLALGKPLLEAHVVPFDIAEVAQPVSEHGSERIGS